MNNHKIYLEPLGITRGLTASGKYFRKLQNSEAYYSHLKIIKRNSQSVHHEIISVTELDDYFSKINENDKREVQKLIENIERIREPLELKNGLKFDFKNPIIQGVLNVTPDSFSDGGEFNEFGSAMDQISAMISDGADIIDIGGESTKPGAKAVTIDEELSRVIPVIKNIKNKKIPISIDSRNIQVMKMAMKSGAHIINDVSALEYDVDSVNIVRGENVPIILMHSQGTPETMQDNPDYQCVYLDIYDYLEERIEHCVKNGISRRNIIVDPGIGFGKTVEHNLQILKHISIFHGLGVPLLIGVSRKSFIGKICNEEIPANRIHGSISAAQHCINRGVHIIRVHDVKETKQAITVLQNIQSS